MLSLLCKLRRIPAWPALVAQRSVRPNPTPAKPAADLWTGEVCRTIIVVLSSDIDSKRTEDPPAGLATSVWQLEARRRRSPEIANVLGPVD